MNTHNYNDRRIHNDEDVMKYFLTKHRDRFMKEDNARRTALKDREIEEMLRQLNRKN
jgi:hypothetical protein